jgi:hypothetical protein
VGTYRVAEVEGPGAIVRGWSAGMGGEWKVYLDGDETPLYVGSGYDFLARRTHVFLERAGLDLDTEDAFCQQDADYLPIPFGKSLRVTWKGNLKELHFYHLEVRSYEAGTRVQTFDVERDLASNREALERAVAGLTRPGVPDEGRVRAEASELDPGGEWNLEIPAHPPAEAIAELTLKLTGGGTPADALRGTLLRIAFDGAHKPQVESPAGDFFGSGVGLNPFGSLPMTVDPGGAMTCRFVMPFRKTARITLFNSTRDAVRAEVKVRLVSWAWDAGSLYFRSKWRTDQQIDMQFGPFDMPYILARGAGRLVGAACMLVNPTPFAHPYGSWWGEGDEKIFVDDETFPSFFGTGSEDYYNYSWSRPDLFDHPYCGQPLDSGPGNSGYCSNHRWHVLDDVPFDRFLAFYMEVWHHSARPGLGYGCIAYLYGRPGMLDDHRRVQLSELKVPAVQPMAPEAGFGTHGATIHRWAEMAVNVEGGVLGSDTRQPAASKGRLVTWRAKAGDRLAVKFSVEKDKDYSVNLVACHWPEGGAVRLLLNGTPLVVENLGGAELGARGEAKLVLKSRFARRLLSTGFKTAALSAGEQELDVECLEDGLFGLDYLWIR